MQIKSFASIILLGLAAISYGRAVDTQYVVPALTDICLTRKQGRSSPSQH